LFLLTKPMSWQNVKYLQKKSACKEDSETYLTLCTNPKMIFNSRMMVDMILE
jgi:hypothetical protein